MIGININSDSKSIILYTDLRGVVQILGRIPISSVPKKVGHCNMCNIIILHIFYIVPVAFITNLNILSLAFS